MKSKRLVVLALVWSVVLAGCVSPPRAHVTGAVYDGEAHGTNDYGLNGLGYPEFTMAELGNPGNPPAAFSYNWELSFPAPTAILTRVATVWGFDAHTHGGNSTNYVSSEYIVFDAATTFHREVSGRLLKEAQIYFNYLTCGWDDSTSFSSAVGGNCNEWNGMDLDCCTANIISVGIYSGIFPTRGSEPVTPLNFVNEGGHARQFTEAELFVQNSGWQKKLSDLCIGRLHHAGDVANGTITHFDPEQLSKFTVSPKTLQIHFDPGPEPGGGETVVNLPWTELRDFLRPNGPARFLIVLQSKDASANNYSGGAQIP